MLKVDSVTFYRDQEPILDAISLYLEPGEVVMVRGENGSGKTTLLKLLAGLLPPQHDLVASLDDQPYDPRNPLTQLELAYVGHTLGIKDDLTCLENLRFLGQFLGRREGRDEMDVIRSVGLDGFQYTLARRMSAGQRKRLALSRLLLCPARIWLLDEPYSNLDGEGINLVDRILQQHIDSGGSALMTSHGTFQPQVSCCREMTLPGSAA